MTHEQPSTDFQAQVQALLAAGKLSDEEARSLLEGSDDPEALRPVTPHHAPELSAPELVENDIPPDLHLNVTGYQLAVVIDPALSTPQLSCNWPDQLHFGATPAGWQLERQPGKAEVQVNRALRAILSVPFMPRNVQAELHGGLLTLPDMAGEIRAEVNGGQLRSGAAASLWAEVNGGNLSAGEIAGPVRTSVNGGNLTLSGAQQLQASVNGGNLNWSGVLDTGQHSLELNAGNATLHLDPGSSVQVAADVTVGSFKADFDTQKQDQLVQTRYNGQLGRGAASLAIKVAAGQVRLVSQ